VAEPTTTIAAGVAATFRFDRAVRGEAGSAVSVGAADRRRPASGSGGRIVVESARRSRGCPRRCPVVAVVLDRARVRRLAIVRPGHGRRLAIGRLARVRRSAIVDLVDRVVLGRPLATVDLVARPDGWAVLRRWARPSVSSATPSRSSVRLACATS
jgi:hypothetical protein